MAEVRVVTLNTPYTCRVADVRNIGSVALRASAATTTSYVASDHADVSAYERLSLEFTLTWVDSTSTQWYVEWSSDGTNWFRSTNTATSTGTHTLTVNEQTLVLGASTKWIHGAFDVADRYVRVAVKKTGGVGADALAVTLVGLTL